VFGSCRGVKVVEHDAEPELDPFGVRSPVGETRNTTTLPSTKPGATVIASCGTNGSSSTVPRTARNTTSA
jgi:hypothetical protein